MIVPMVVRTILTA